MRERFSSLWRNSDFLKLWSGQTVSLFGSRITYLALPLTAITMLKAAPVQMGLLAAMQLAPFMIVALFAGLWVDRLPRRPIMIAADIGRGALLLVVPLLALLNRLNMEALYIVSFLVGVLGAFFDLAYQAYVPSLVSRAVLMDANSKLQVSASAAEIGGPGLAGVLIDRIAAPLALLVDAVSFFISSLSLLLIRHPESPPRSGQASDGIWHAIGEGFRIVLRDLHLRALLTQASLYNLFASAFDALFILFATTQLGLSPVSLGIVFSVGSVGALIGALASNRLMHVLRLGPALMLAYALACVPCIGIPFLRQAPLTTVFILAAIYVVLGIGSAVAQVYVWSLRQTLVSSNLLGRMNASYRFFVTGASPIGALLGGFLGEAIGLRPTLMICAFGLLAGWITAMFSPLRVLEQLPEEPKVAAEAVSPAG